MVYRTPLAIENNKNLIVLDNSVVMRWMFCDGSQEDLDYAEAVLNYMKLGQLKAIVPSLWVSESSFVTANYVKKQEFSIPLACEKLAKAFEMFSVIDSRYDPVELFKFSIEYNISSYDANYALLAKTYDCTLATLDKKLRKAVVRSRGKLLEL